MRRLPGNGLNRGADGSYFRESCVSVPVNPVPWTSVCFHPTQQQLDHHIPSFLPSDRELPPPTFPCRDLLFPTIVPSGRGAGGEWISWFERRRERRGTITTSGLVSTTLDSSLFPLVPDQQKEEEGVCGVWPILDFCFVTFHQHQFVDSEEGIDHGLS